MSTRLIVPAIISALLFTSPVLAAGAHHDNYRGPAMKRSDTEVIIHWYEEISSCARFCVLAAR